MDQSTFLPWDVVPNSAFQLSVLYHVSYSCQFVAPRSALCLPLRSTASLVLHRLVLFCTAADSTGEARLLHRQQL